jgi:hypothetical protein
MSIQEMHTEDPFYKGVCQRHTSQRYDRIVSNGRLDGEHIQPWGEGVKPQSLCKLVYVHTQQMQFANSKENHIGYSQFVVPEEFAEDLEESTIHYVTLAKNGKETGVKYRLTKVE